jgi:hypothetical protein
MYNGGFISGRLLRSHPNLTTGLKTNQLAVKIEKKRKENEIK